MGERRANRGSTPLRTQLREQRAAVYREAVAAAAERVFATKGTDRSHMREIAAEAGISLGTLYGVVDGKQSLFFGIHRVRMQEFFACIRAARDSRQGTLERHLAVLRLGAAYFLERPNFLRMCCRDGYSWSARFPAWSDENDLWEEGASIPRRLFERGISEGVYIDDDAELLVRKMLALKQTELTYWVDQGMKLSQEEVLDRLERQFIRAFCRDPEAVRRARS